MAGCQPGTVKIQGWFRNRWGDRSARGPGGRPTIAGNGRGGAQRDKGQKNFGKLL